MGSLDLETIQKLLKDETAKNAVIATKLAPESRERPVQVGPLRWFDQTDRCANRGCSSPCLIKIKGVPYCTTHALYALNKLYVDELFDTGQIDIDLHECDCNAGKHSMGNIHTEGCPIFAKVKENDSSKSSSGAS